MIVPPRSGAHRRAETKVRVLSAAGRILKRDGYARLTMERVAAESGVAKTTLYRSWPTKAALCMDLYLDVAGRELHDPRSFPVAFVSGPRASRVQLVGDCRLA
jgi:AcrR family transcriptional regulator